MRLIVSGENSLPQPPHTVKMGSAVHCGVIQQELVAQRESVENRHSVSTRLASSESFQASPSLIGTNTSTWKNHPEAWIQHYLSRNLHCGGFFRSQFAEMGDEMIAAKLHDAQIRCEYLGWAGGFTGIDCHETERLTKTPYGTNRNRINSNHANGRISVNHLDDINDDHTNGHVDRHKAIPHPPETIQNQQKSDDVRKKSQFPPKTTTCVMSQKRTPMIQTCSWRYAVDDATNAIRTAAILGSRALLVRGGPQGLHIRRHATRLFFNAVTELLPIAEDMEVVLALGELTPNDLLAAKAMPWWSLFGRWAGLIIDFERWTSPSDLAQLQHNITKIASVTTLIDIREHSISEAMPLLQLFAEAGYDGDVLISFDCFDQIVTEQRSHFGQTTVSASSHPSNSENFPQTTHPNTNP